MFPNLSPALVAAACLSAPDALRLVARRGALMADAEVSGGMVAVIGLGRGTVTAVVASIDAGQDLVVANDNAPGQIVISGSPVALDAVSEPLRAAGARRLIPLNVSGPFHSPLMAGLGAELARSFGAATWRDADPPVVSNVTAEPVCDAAEIRNLLAQQVHSPVEWVRSVQRMVGDGVDTFVECGPGGALTGMVRRIAPAARILTVFDPESLEASVSALLAADVGVAV
jgi:[acyl-carrier-protein] S-malonyltransferase